MAQNSNSTEDSDEQPGTQVNTFLILVAGFVLWFIGNALKAGWLAPEIQFYVGWAFLALGTALFWLGCTLHVRAIGYPWPIGFLSLTLIGWGLGGLVGPGVLLSLPDRSATPNAPPPERSKKQQIADDQEHREWMAIIVTIVINAALAIFITRQIR